ncbi:hypothetical protein GCM10025868_13950 [Angustibacter aerolatus]|uniref:AI-2E family transporter n=1 Tax=Angustibacter aerolatus TaxID=1162965 RepID=A0ABQ6JD86_9ACTN|nr:AI-2E family transporter [Angustibacter aerolatus]GMA86145.1 hypothetical protein GCM10025868_13950 [Angustibacter aerolatus]
MSQEHRTGAETVPWAMRVAVAWSWRLILVCAAVYLLLRVVASYLVVVAPVLIAVLLVALIKPLADGLERVRVRRGLGSLATVLLVLLVVSGLFTLVGTQIASGFSDLQDQAVAGLGEVQRWVNGPPLRISTTQAQRVRPDVPAEPRRQPQRAWSRARSRPPAPPGTSSPGCS